jgi:peptidoglycan L-alanyl-D-glutamate endopeptidase CwlK
MTFKLSANSMSKMTGIKDELHTIVCEAIRLTKVDFGVICGKRTEEEQQELVAKGASQTMKSKHLTGDAVDLMAYVGSRASWELNLYDDIADAMKQAAKNKGVKIRWGAAWHIDNFAEYEGSAEDAMNDYIDLRRSQGRRPFIDGPHFELN